MYGSPIDDGSYMDDETRISRRHDTIQRFSKKDSLFKKKETEVTRKTQMLPKQARSVETQADPSFVLSKFLYHMAHLPTVSD